MGTWNTDNVDVAHAEYSISGNLDGVSTCGFRVALVSFDSNGTFVEADAETMLDALIAALGTDADINIVHQDRVYPTYQSYTP